MADYPAIEFSRQPHPGPVSLADRNLALANPGFGTVSPITWCRSTGWKAWAGTMPISARASRSALDPATAVLHYAQEIFEGLKAYRLTDGGIALFRPEANARRFNASAARLAMPSIPEETVHRRDPRTRRWPMRDWFPSVEGGSLYLRPFMFASEPFLGVRPAKEYKFLVIASPAGNYFKSGAPAVSIWVSSDYTRAAPGGTGAAKCGGNYAASLVPQAEAIAHGHDQVVFLDAVERKWIEELGGMNLFFVFDDGSIITPPLGGIDPARHHTRKPDYAGPRGWAGRAGAALFDRSMAGRCEKRQAG